MQIVVDGSEFEIEQRRVGQVMGRAGDTIRLHVKHKALAAKAAIQLAMPFRTGRAKASWGNVPAPPPALPDDGIWEVKDGGFTIVQGSNVEYIVYLNEGSSSQQPAGFIDAEEVKAMADLDNDLSDALIQLFEGGL